MPDPTQNPQNPPPAAPEVRNQATKPPGILPKNAQTWVIAGVSAVMVAAIALSGNGSKSKTATTLPQTAGVIDPNASRIAEYRNRLEEETRKLASEQATLNQAKQAAAVADPRVASAIQPAIQPGAAATAYAPPPRLSPPDDRQSAQRQLEAERERKEYNSLFASNVALSLRKEPEDASPVSAVSSPAEAYPYIAAVPRLDPGAGPPLAQAAPAAPIPARRSASEVSKNVIGNQPQAKPDPALTAADGKSYRLLEGTLFETVLTNRLTGSLAGPVNAMLTTDVYSHDGQHLLIPRGSRILGEVRPVSNFGQQRLAVVFHRILMPDGYSVSLDQFQGLNQIGETGLRDQVNHHYLQIFGISIAIGAVAGLSEAGTQFGFTESAIDEYRHGFAASLSQSALRILDRFLNIPPTFTIREGHRIKIYLASDLSLPAYEQHSVPTDF